MRANSIKIHNFRSFGEVEINLNAYSILVGANNVGKSNLIDAIRIFYEKDIKFDEERDFPKFQTKDKESWIEIHYKPSPNELAQLKDEYKLIDGTFRVRKYFVSFEKDVEGKIKNGIYAYVNGRLSDTRFYGTRNVQQGKLGEIIYIPAVSKLDEHTKLSGPSALRDLINSILKNIISNSPAYTSLIKAFEGFGTTFKTENTPEGLSLQGLEEEISFEISKWGTSFELFISPTTPDELVKSLIGLRLKDQTLDQFLDPKSYGQGFQRNLIFTLMRLATRIKISPANEQERKEFLPTLTWILFEEPEAFLHPNQIDTLNDSMNEITSDEGNQILISTHSPQFVSRNIDELPSLARLYKNGPLSIVKQVSLSSLNSIFSSNQQDLGKWQDAGIPIHTDDFQIEMESIKYALWLNPFRCCALFSNKILLVEGPTETAIIGFLINTNRIRGRNEGVFVFDSLGKFNIHRFMNLFGELGIYHAVLFDQDKGKESALVVESTIYSSQNEYTIGVDYFPTDIEHFLGIPTPVRSNRKPQHAMYHLKQGTVEESKIIELVEKIHALLKIQ